MLTREYSSPHFHARAEPECAAPTKVQSRPLAPVAQWIECWPPKPEVVGSIPAGRANCGCQSSPRATHPLDRHACETRAERAHHKRKIPDGSGILVWWWSVTENQTHISAVSQPRSEALRLSRDSGEGFRATAHAHDCKFREANWHSQLPQLPGNLGAATWLSSRLSP